MPFNPSRDVRRNDRQTGERFFMRRHLLAGLSLFAAPPSAFDRIRAGFRASRLPPHASPIPPPALCSRNARLPLSLSLQTKAATPPSAPSGGTSPGGSSARRPKRWVFRSPSSAPGRDRRAQSERIRAAPDHDRARGAERSESRAALARSARRARGVRAGRRRRRPHATPGSTTGRWCRTAKSIAPALPPPISHSTSRSPRRSRRCCRATRA